MIKRNLNKIEDDENSVEAVQNRSMEILSETKKIEAVEPQMKRARNNGSETIQLMKEKYENEREIRLKGLELKKNKNQRLKQKNQKEMKNKLKHQFYNVSSKNMFL